MEWNGASCFHCFDENPSWDFRHISSARLVWVLTTTMWRILSGTYNCCMWWRFASKYLFTLWHEKAFSVQCVCVCLWVHLCRICCRLCCTDCRSSWNSLSSTDRVVGAIVLVLVKKKREENRGVYVTACYMLLVTSCWSENRKTLSSPS